MNGKPSQEKREEEEVRAPSVTIKAARKLHKRRFHLLSDDDLCASHLAIA